LNIDKQFPNQIFTVFIKKENLVNFSYDPIDLIGSQICTKGKVQSIGGTPTMYLSDENKLEVIKDSK
jgi:endonuclease G